MSNMLSVIIPFYQRESGILIKTINSVIQQEKFTDFNIIIVDDGSPVSAVEELCFIIEEKPDLIKVIHQKNQGVGAARNTGLDSIVPTTKYVAFLDSDDTWVPNHLYNAIQTLELGYKIYFSNIFHLDQEKSHFQKIAYINELQHKKIKNNNYEYIGDMDRQIVESNILFVQTMVINFDCFREVRFRERYRYAGEDYIYFVELIRKTKLIAFSMEPECIRDHGVNIYCSSGWGTSNYLSRISDEISYNQELLCLGGWNSETLKLIQKKISKLRVNYASDIIHRIHHLRFKSLGQIKKQLFLDPKSIIFLPWYAILSLLKI